MAQAAPGKAEPFTVRIPDERLARIAARVRDFPWYGPPLGPDGRPLGWRYGTDAAFLRRIADRWTGGYDWRATEAG